MNKHLFYSLRILYKYRLYTGISIIGLGIAIASCWFISNFVFNAYQYDTFHPNAPHIYRLNMEVAAGGSSETYAATGEPLGQILKEKYSGIDAYARITFHRDVSIQIQEQSFKEDGFYSANPETLQVFGFDFISGNQTSATSSPHAVLLSEKTAMKYFNKVDVIDEELTIAGTPYDVKGVYRDWPENSHLKIDVLMLSALEEKQYEPQDWFNLDHYNYVLLDPQSSEAHLNSTLTQLEADELAPVLKGSGIAVKLNAEPLEGLYYAPALTDDVPKGNLSYVHGITLAGILLLLIAGINYVNLSLTQSTMRVKEFAMKKTLGISRSQLWTQGMLESLTMAILIFLFAGILVLSFDNLYAQYSGFHALEIGTNGMLLLFLFMLLVLLGLSGTGYSGAQLSFSGSLVRQHAVSQSLFKKGILGLQFVLAAVIMVATLTIYQQIGFMKNKDLGLTKDQVLMVHLPDNEVLQGQYANFKEQLQKYETIKETSLIAGGALPGEENGKDIFEVSIDGSKQEKVFNIYRVDEHFTDLLEIPMLLGRNFQGERPGDKDNTAIINQALALSMQWENPVGQSIWYGDKQREIIGVVQDFHHKSLHHIIEPVVMLYGENHASKLLVKADPTEAGMIGNLWKKNFPDTPFELSYYDRFWEAKYAQEDLLARLLGFFSFISLALCCMGLFATFSLNMLQKTKEISIRKILGAGIGNLLVSTTKSYVTLQVLALLVAFPLAWLLMDSWLTGFSYRIGMGPGIFMLCGTLLLAGSGATLAYHVTKALLLKPVDALKGE